MLRGCNKTNYNKSQICYNFEKIGHMAKDCCENMFAEKIAALTSQVKAISCNYCRKPEYNMFKKC